MKKKSAPSKTNFFQVDDAMILKHFPKYKDLPKEKLEKLKENLLEYLIAEFKGTNKKLEKQRKNSVNEIIMAALKTNPKKRYSPSELADVIESDYKKLKLKNTCSKACADNLWRLWKNGLIFAYEDSTYSYIEDK